MLRPWSLGGSGRHAALHVALLFWFQSRAFAETSSPDPERGSNPNLASQPAPTEPLEVTAVGSRAPLSYSRRAPTTASTVIEGEALRAAGTSSADILARVPGVQVASSGSQADLATASIRGSDSKQVPIYLAGIRLNDDVSGTADLSMIPLWMIERVEVFRGNAPMDSDRLGLGGAIFFTPRTPQKTRAGAAVELGSFGERGGSVAYEVGSKNAAALVAVRRIEADNDYLYVNDHGQRFDLDETEARRSNADFSSYDSWAIGRFRTGRGAYVTSVVNVFQREQGVSGLSVIPARHARAETERLLVGVSAHTPCAAEIDKCTLDLSSSAVVASTTFDDRFFELPGLGTSLLENQGQRISERASLKWKASSSFDISGSVEQSLESLQIHRVDDNERVAQRASGQAALGTTWDITRRLSQNDLLAIECHGTRATAASFGPDTTEEVDTCEPSIRGGASFDLAENLTLLGNIGRYVRVPTLTELYGSSPAVSGNPSLSSETGISTDLGLRVTRLAPRPRDLSLSLDAFVFARYATNLIRYQRASRDAVAPFNVASARILGTEIAVGFDWLRHLRGEAATTLLDPRETTDDPRLDPTRNDILPLTSRLVAVAHLEYYCEPRPSVFDALRFGVRYLHRSSRFEDPAGQTVLPAQDFFDLEAASTFLGGGFEARLALRNVFDSRQYDLLGLPLPGRSVHLEAEAWF